MNKVKKVGLFECIRKFVVQNRVALLCCGVMMFLMVSGVASADVDRAEELWTQVSTLLEKWVTRLGGVIMFVGIITFGIGWRSEDAGQKISGMNTIIGGAIVCAGAAMVASFFF